MNFFESDEKKQIKQNIQLIIDTFKYSCCFARDFGIKGEFLDKNQTQAETIMKDEIVTAVAKYEPRAVIDEVSFEYDSYNKMIPIVTIKEG